MKKQTKYQVVKLDYRSLGVNGESKGKEECLFLRTNLDSCWVVDYNSHHLVRRLVEQCTERKRNLHKVFTDLAKMCDEVSPEVLYRCLEARDVPIAC